MHSQSLEPAEHNRRIFTRDTSKSAARFRVSETSQPGTKFYFVSAGHLDDLRLVVERRLETDEVSWEDLKQQLGL